MVQKELEAMGNVLESAGDLLEEVYFTSIYPNVCQVSTWHTSLVHAHVPSAIFTLQRDAQRFAEQIPLSKEITIPSCEKVTVNPERLAIL